MPQLRFPDFDGEWEPRRLGEVSTDVMYGMNASAREFDGEHKYLRITDIDENTRDFTPNPLTSPDEVPDIKFKLKTGDIVFTRTGASVGKTYLYNEKDGNLFFAGFLIKFSINNAHPFFIYTQTLRSPYSKWVMVMSMRSGQPGINAEEYKTLRLFLPVQPEQQKIASFFTTIDQKITQLKQKKTLLEQYKKGVMQKIFSQEIRFKVDNNKEFPKWEKNKFSQIYSFRVTNSFSRDDLNYEEGEVKNIHYGDIHTKFQTLFDVTKEDVPFINPDISIKRISSDNYCKTSDMVFADASEDLVDVGKSIELVNLNNEKVLAGLHTILARPDISRIASGFGGYLMMSIDVRKQIMKFAQGSKITSISSTRLCDIELNIPCPAEQNKIADFLSAIDVKISHTQKQIEKAETWKKGLLQKMFV